MKSIARAELELTWVKSLTLKGQGMSEKYRPCVVAVICDDQGRCLVGERADHKGAWQLPQGGIDPGENPQVAVLRELHEEIGTNDVRIVREAPELIRYRFPPGVQKGFMKDWVGQEQTWFLLQLAPGAKPDLTLSEGEFQGIAWQDPKTVLQGIIEWKRDAYRQGFKALGLIKG
jgi:putative (di)nucleoside polyphosphate hydrolase